MSCPVEYNHNFNVSGFLAVANKWNINCNNSEGNNKSEHDDKCPLNCSHCGLGLRGCVYAGLAENESKCKNLTGSGNSNSKNSERKDKQTRQQEQLEGSSTTSSSSAPLDCGGGGGTWSDNKSSMFRAQLRLNFVSSVYFEHLSGLFTLQPFSASVFSRFSQVISAWRRVRLLN